MASHRRMIVMRHAKSSWANPLQSDHARTLNEKGRSDALLIAKTLETRNWIPDVVYLSDSERTRETMQRMRIHLDDAKEYILSELYHATLMDVVSALGDSLEGECPMLLGHNPGWEMMVDWLSGSSISLQSGSVTLLERTVDETLWHEKGTWSLVELILPSNLL